MKIKKLLAGFLAATMILGCSVCGFAAGSAGPGPAPVPPTPPTPPRPYPVGPVRPGGRPAAPAKTTTKVTTPAPAKQLYKTESKVAETANYKLLKTSKPEIADLIDGVNAGTVDLAAVAAAITDPAVAAKLANKDFVTPFFDLDWTDGVTEEEKNTIKNAEGKYVVDLNIPALTETLTGVQVLCYDVKDGEWLVENTTALDLAKKTLSAGLKNFGPVAVISDLAA